MNGYGIVKMTLQYFRSKPKTYLLSSVIPKDSNDFPASICTSHLCEERYINIKLKLYCLVQLNCFNTSKH